MYAKAEKEYKGRRASANSGAGAAIFFLSAFLALSFVSISEAGLPFTGSDVSLRRNVVSAGGTVSSGGGVSLNAALSEAAISTCAGGAFKLGAGYMPMAAQPGSIVSLTAVTQSTGVVELSWSAPGLDGFVGGVASGWYRIDVSSDYSHVFDPTTYQTEFSTSVAPGDAQTYTLTGLEPNTTYYARIYLVDDHRSVAETSDTGTRSTLANLPVSPVLDRVFDSSATFSWLLPSGTAAGFRLDASSTSFGALAQGGLLQSSITPQGLAITLTVTGLYPHTVYYFKLGSLNWEGAINFDTIIATRTTGYPMPILALASARDALGRKVRFNWTKPDYPDLTGVLVQVSTAPITAAAQDGADYTPGAVLPDGSMVLSNVADTEQLHDSLGLDTTYYYRFLSHDSSLTYSVFISTECLLDLPPMSPAGLQASLDAARSSITLTWDRVTSNEDGSLFTRTAEPFELAHYDIYRATGIIVPSWSLVTSVPLSVSSVTLPVPDPASDYFYKVEAIDGLGTAGISMAADTSRNVYAIAPDNITRLMIPAELAHTMLAASSPNNKYRFFRATEKPEDEGGKVVKSVQFELVEAPEGLIVPFRLDKPDMQVVLRYEAVNGDIVPSGAAKAAMEGSPLPQTALASVVKVADAAYALGSYWHNGSDFVKVFGSVNAADQTVTVRTALPGAYQIRSLARSSGVSFDVKEMSNKAITPNGDGLNDYVTFTLDNPRDSAFSGKIFELSGAFVSDMKPGSQIADTLIWDGKAGGRTVPRGVYIYQIKAEEKTFNGTIVVVR